MKQWSGWFALALTIALGSLSGCYESSTLTPGQPDAAMDCECSMVSECCDGCYPRSEGDWCVGSSSATETSFGTCDETGSCSGEGSTCWHTQCQVATSEILPVCAVENASVGTPCDDGDPDTDGDECAADGTCQGR